MYDTRIKNSARSHSDAVEGYRIVYEAMGHDKAFTDRIISRHKQ